MLNYLLSVFDFCISFRCVLHTFFSVFLNFFILKLLSARIWQYILLKLFPSLHLTTYWAFVFRVLQSFAFRNHFFLSYQNLCFLFSTSVHLFSCILKQFCPFTPLQFLPYLRRPLVEQPRLLHNAYLIRGTSAAAAHNQLRAQIHYDRQMRRLSADAQATAACREVCANVSFPWESAGSDRRSPFVYGCFGS